MGKFIVHNHGWALITQHPVIIRVAVIPFKAVSGEQSNSCWMVANEILVRFANMTGLRFVFC